MDGPLKHPGTFLGSKSKVEDENDDEVEDDLGGKEPSRNPVRKCSRVLSQR
jgi:hypothetical protein